MPPVAPIFTLDVFAALQVELLALLRSLTPAQWDLTTAAAPWTVKDVAAHLLYGDIRRLSAQRDGYSPSRSAEITSYTGLVDFINRDNAAWTQAASAFSPRLLLHWLEDAGQETLAYVQTLDPFAPALFGVAWAGEWSSPNWFDLAREYTEKWHHQQHIREAAGAPGLTSRRWLHPVLDTFMRALPHHYRTLPAAEGDCLEFIITGEAGGVWTLVRQQQTEGSSRWQLCKEEAVSAKAETVGSPNMENAEAKTRNPPPRTRITLPQDVAWRLLTKGLSPAAALASGAEIAGEHGPGLHFLEMLAIIA